MVLMVTFAMGFTVYKLVSPPISKRKWWWQWWRIGARIKVDGRVLGDKVLRMQVTSKNVMLTGI